ncbi:peptidase, partial [Pseudoalteromonas sp. DL2-H6]|nr:peptidase [Pseudoalteromonas sp. DL2-H6]
MKLTSAIIATSLLATSVAVNAAIPYKNEQYQFTQPSGEVITLILNGNTYFAQQRTIDGELVVYDASLKGMAYAQVSADGEQLISTGKLVTEQEKLGIKSRSVSTE